MSEAECLDQVEILMRRKAIAVADFPQEKVILKALVKKKVLKLCVKLAILGCILYMLTYEILLLDVKFCFYYVVV